MPWLTKLGWTLIAGGGGVAALKMLGDLFGLGG